MLTDTAEMTVQVVDVPDIDEVLNLTLDLKAGEEKLFGDARKVCMLLLPGWEGYGASDLTVKTISGGITNILMKVHDPVLVAYSGVLLVFIMKYSSDPFAYSIRNHGSERQMYCEGIRLWCGWCISVLACQAI